MDETDYIYGRTRTLDDDCKVLVKMYVPKRIKTGLDSLKLASGKNLQQLAAEAIEQYLHRELTARAAPGSTPVTA